MLQQLIDQYGYLALFIGTFMEGETIYVLAMLAAKLGYLDPVTTMLVGFVGTLAGDQFFFFLGRMKGREVLRRRPAWRLRIRHIDRLLRRRPVAVMLGYRFLYGIRAITPFAIGLSGIPIRKFFLLNVAGAALWAFVIGVLTLMFGELLETYLGNLKRYEFILFGSLAAIGLLVWLIMRLRRKKRMAAVAEAKAATRAAHLRSIEQAKQQRAAQQSALQSVQDEDHNPANSQTGSATEGDPDSHSEKDR